MKDNKFELNGKKFKLYEKVGQDECIGCYFHHLPMKDGCAKTPIGCLEKASLVYVEDNDE